jgi:hypothetical protein
VEMLHPQGAQSVRSVPWLIRLKSLTELRSINNAIFEGRTYAEVRVLAESIRFALGRAPFGGDSLKDWEVDGKTTLERRY